MTNSPSNALPLADIQLQNAPGLWPLAWGWWLLIVALLAAVLLAAILLRKRAKRVQARNEALVELTQSDSLSKINALLKRAALSYFDRDHVAKLTGTPWLTFLDSQLPATKHSFMAHDELWQKGIFAKEGLTDSELAQCRTLAAHWLKHALPPKASLNVINSKEANHV
ncbi:DUF4381 domain-containing protein [Enterovibrio sp. ZSDZ42]|uniref:DUF4381 domain-containing protein n=1 Tax=Enterovibrio gelatinilyticus TaxID=2899819 RepID=A0ABT5R5E9_9GAMM|nr:DUF4381 domain-containing protein [Enterovibrio sp. ZSDZ42]MDD1795070.1 DUF4381 domain-containing protein [Enterovibrio sp. ZSDZ42]